MTITTAVYCYVQQDTRRSLACLRGSHRSWRGMSIARYRHKLRNSVASHSLEDASDARRVNRKRGTRDD